MNTKKVGYVLGLRTKLLAIATLAVAGVLATAVISSGSRQRPIVLGQTEGWAGGELQVFDYGLNFVCANAPLNDAECIVGVETSITTSAFSLDPADTPDIIVIVPFFDSAATSDASFLPEFLEGALGTPGPGPDTFVQCPETQSAGLAGGTPFGSFGHCIFHDTFLDLSPVVGVLAGVVIPGLVLGADTSVTVAELLTALGVGGSITDLAGFEDDPTIVDLPLPNHTHLVEDTIGGVEQAWDIKVVLVLSEAIWPDADGNCSAGSGCLTSFEAVASAPAGSIIGPVPTTLFLFFGVHGLGH